MATYFARKSGNINANDVWATTPSGTAGAQTFVAGDILVANSFTITVNVSTDLGNGTVTNDNRDGATAGGSFSLSNGVTLTANLVTGSATLCTLASTASATIVGNITGATGGTSQRGVNHTSTGSLTVTGNITAGTATGATGVIMSAGSLTVTGNVTGGTGNTAEGINNSSGGNVTITGNVTGGSGASSAGYNGTGSSAVTITGTVMGGSVGNGVTSQGTNAVTIVGRAKGGSVASGAVGCACTVTTASVTVDEVEWGDLGASPTSGPIAFANKTSNVAVVYRVGLSKKTLVDTASTALFPAASDVRHGVSYNAGASTGTCRVPTAANVLQGVLVDNTTGTALMTPADFWAYATASATTAGSMGERLKNAATVASVGQALSDALTP